MHQRATANRTVFANEHGVLGSLQLRLERDLRVLLDELEEALVTKHFATFDKHQPQSLERSVSHYTSNPALLAGVRTGHSDCCRRTGSSGS